MAFNGDILIGSAATPEQKRLVAACSLAKVVRRDFFQDNLSQLPDALSPAAKSAIAFWAQSLVNKPAYAQAQAASVMLSNATGWDQFQTFGGTITDDFATAKSLVATAINTAASAYLAEAAAFLTEIQTAQ